MTMRFLNTVVLFFLSLGLYAQEYTVSLAINGFGGQTTYLTKVEGDLSILIDTLTSDSYGLFKVNFSDEDETGFYKFIFPQLNSAEVPFIFNKENVALSTEVVNPSGYIQVMSSKENDLYYQFLQKNAILKNQADLLEMIYENYVGDEFRSQAEAEYTRIIQKYYADISDFQKRGKGTYAWKVIKSSATQLPPMLVAQSEKNLFLKSHYFDNVDFTDTTLINSSVFNNAAIQYLSIYTSQIQQANKNNIFMAAVDTILEKTSVNETINDFMVDYLLGGFESMGATEIVSYISQKYITEHTCGSDNKLTTLQRKAYSNQELAVGKNAPLEQLNIMNYKKEINYENENVVIVFWATWCSHCRETIPNIADHYASIIKPKYKLVTISLDSTTNEWERFIALHPSLEKCKNFIDTDGWDGKIAETYYVYATPTIFMLQKGKIVAKPIDFDEFLEALKRQKWE